MVKKRVICKKNKFFKYPEPNSKTVFKLEKIEENVYYFKCGHKVHYSVFIDLIDIYTGIAEWQKPKQLTLNLL